MSKKRSPAELDALASTSIEFEFRMLICQVREFLVECPNELFGAGLPNCRVDALLEAWLVHIRLIDEFFYSSGSEKTAKAVNWKQDWSSQGILTPAQRRAVSAQVAHIGWDRKRWTPATRPPWEHQVRAWTTACCRELERFIATIPTPRKPAFEKARLTAEGWLKSLS